MKSSNRLRPAGFTLLETLVGASVAVVGMAGVGFLNSAHLRYVQSARQSNAATLALQERVEQMRLADWRKITDPTYLKDTLYGTAPRSSERLPRFTEEVTVEAYPDATVAQQLIVQRLPNGNRVALLSGDGLATQRLAKVDLQISWTGTDGRTRLRATTTVISNSGISRMNLPGFGGTTTGTTATSTPVPSTPVPSGTPDPSATPAPATPVPATPVPVKNSRGNVGGRPGKK